MKRPILALVAGIAVGLAWVTVQQAHAQYPAPGPEPASDARPAPPRSPAAPPSADPKAPLSLTGCLIQGSGSTVFILDNARLDPADRSEKGKTYLIASSGTALDFEHQLNHEVRVTGTTSEKAPPSPAAGKLDEKLLPTLSAQSLTSISNSCMQVPS